MGELVHVTDRVLVHTSRLYTTTSTVIIGDGGSCLVVDPAATPADLAQLAAHLRDNGLFVTAGFSTHPHWDHLLWTRGLGPAPRFATEPAVRAARTGRAEAWREAQDSAPGHDAELFARVEPLPEGATSIPWPGPQVRVVEHHAHAPGHAALHVPSEKLLLTGDMCSDVEIPLLDLNQPDPVGDYRYALDLIATIGHGVTYVIPGHGSVGDGDELRRRVDADHRYLDRLEAGGGGEDPRLTTDWLIEAHRAHLRHLTATREL